MGGSARVVFRRPAGVIAVAGTMALATAALVSPAQAKQEYYDAVTAGTDTCHDCRLCHSTVIGQSAPTEPKPFFVNWIRVAGPTSPTLPETSDADGDLIPDRQELTEDGDPNDPAVGPGQYECPTGPSPEFGCARVAPRDPDVDGVALLASALLVGLMLLRRRHDNARA